MTAVQSTQATAYDVVVIGAGPAGLASALNLVRCHARVLLLDANRPRHAATLQAHGFITRDGVAPGQLRQLGRQEFLNYPAASYQMARVTGVAAAAAGMLRVEFTPARGVATVTTVFTRRVVIATGITEQLPPVEQLRAYYGTALHSCLVCDGYEKTGQPLVLLPHPQVPAAAVASAARLLKRFSDRVTVVSDAVELRGERAQLRAVLNAAGVEIPATAGFVLPLTTVQTEFLAAFGVPAQCPEGLQAVAAKRPKAVASNIGIAGVYAVGEAYTGLPQQLLVAAGSGAAVVPQLLQELELEL